MSTVLRPVGYSGFRQQLVWPDYWGSQVTAYLWGGAGGGGGGDGGQRGGNGTGGGYASVTFNVVAGDVIDVAVGGPGGGGQGNRSAAAGGSAGASLTGETVWNTLDALGPGYVRSQNRAYCSFLNQFGIWGTDIYSGSYDRTFTINFPASGYYTFTGSADNAAFVAYDGIEILSIRSFDRTYNTTIYANAGNHSVRVFATNSGGPGSIGVTIEGGLDSYSGGSGGSAGHVGASGAGGGSGGATVVRVNGAILGIGGGGAGGGGAGYGGGGPGNAPGPNGQSGSEPAGQNGGTHPYDGGGGGAGGGGFRGGNGGFWGGGPSGYSDTFGQGGGYGSSSGWDTSNPSGTTPGGTNNIYYGGNSVGGQGSTNNGAQGAAGKAVFAFEVSGIQVVSANDWRPVKQVYLKNSGIWKAAQAVYVKASGSWQPVLGATPLTFSPVAGFFGVFSRNGPAYIPPDPMGMGMGGPMFDIF